MKVGKHEASRKYSTDKLMINISKSLIRDFRSNLSDPTIYSDYSRCFGYNTVDEARKFDHKLDYDSDAYSFKCAYQIETLFKRYRFEKDLYSRDELVEMAELSFLSNQDRLSSIALHSIPFVYKNVLQVARREITKILGDFSEDEHLARCRFGRRATVGVPARAACEAARYQLPISGSKDHITWFVNNIVDKDISVRNYIEKQLAGGSINSAFQVCDTLKLTLVDKTYKALRSIVPNTTLGSFHSSGLGDMISERLKRIGLDIRTLQKRHGRLARTGSITGTLVTCDQSMASDNITVALVERLIPKPWFDALNLGRINTLTLPSGKSVQMSTFCTMGTGFTFPLQTLIFYALVRALDILYFNGRSLISAYGDDLIYTAKLHPFVSTIFPMFGLVLNQDKTFDSGCFRESCGSDYYSGVNVRPFQPKSVNQHYMARIGYESFLYKIINGLRRRWLDEEIEGTLEYLLSEVSAVARGILRVPFDYPDGCGIKVSHPHELDLYNLGFAPTKNMSNGRTSFFYLAFTLDRKKEVRHEPYLWKAIQTTEEGYDHESNRGNSHSSYWDCAGYRRFISIRDYALIFKETPMPMFVEQKAKVQPKSYRSNISGRRLKRVDTTLPKHGSGVILRQTGTTILW